MPNLHITGGARTAVELGRQMADRGHQFSILIPAGRKKLPVPANIEVIECGFRMKSPILTIPSAMIGMTQKIPQVDVIIGSMPPYAILSKFISSKRKVMAINYMLSDDVHIFDDGSHIRSNFLLTVYRAVAKFAIRHVPSMVNSHWTAVQSVGNGGKKPIGIVPSGFDANLFSQQQTHKELNNPVRLVTVGRKQRAKGLADVINALNLIEQNRYPFELKVISQDDLNMTSARFPYTTVSPKDDNELASHYCWGDIFVYASWSEGFGLPPLEAQACGLAVVSTDCGGVREYLRDRDNCLLVSPRDPTSLARAITKMMDDHQLRETLIKRGLETCKEYRWESVADQFEAVMEKLVGT